jgi:heterodisulfide reductase subunit A
VVLGPSILVEAMGQGKRAAYFIDRFLKGESLDNVTFDHRLPMVQKDAVLKGAKDVSKRAPMAIPQTPPHKRIQSFEAYEKTLSEEEARNAANRCLDCAGCSLCRQCEKACPAGAINFDMEPERIDLTVGTVVLSTGYSILDPKLKPLLGYGRYPNVITSPQMDRLLAPTRPYNAVLRPSDGKEPENIAMVLCTGARDHTVCNPTCCRVGCMYAAKHAQLLMGALPLAEVTIYYIDIRAFGKGYDEFFEQSKGMGVNYVKGKVARISETSNHNLVVHYDDIAAGKGHQQAEHDMVVLSVGLVPNTDAFRLFEKDQLERDDLDYVKELDEIGEPGRTSIDGVFAAGTVSGARDIPDTVLHAGAATAQAAAYQRRASMAALAAGSDNTEA